MTSWEIDTNYQMKEKTMERKMEGLDAANKQGDSTITHGFVCHTNLGICMEVRPWRV